MDGIELALRISSRILENPTFSTDRAQLYIEYLQNMLRIPPGSPVSEEQFVRALQAAIHLATSRKPEFQTIAYQIAVTALAHGRSSARDVKDAVQVILEKLGNYPAMRLLGGSSALPLWLGVEAISRREANRLPVSSQDLITLNDFQAELWRTLVLETSCVITAPTSAGKSFVLQWFVVSTLLSCKRGHHILYVVPTRTLISQITRDLTAKIHEATRLTEVRDIRVYTLPRLGESPSDVRSVFVLTQERLHMLLESLQSSGENLSIDLAIFDEAHTISDDSRGVLLQSAVERTRAYSSDAKFVFCSPPIRNPECFRETFAIPDMARCSSAMMPVLQNLITVETSKVRGKNEAKLDIGVIIGGGVQHLGERTIPGHSTSDAVMLAKVCVEFGHLGQSLVYNGMPAACEDVARFIVDALLEQERMETSIDPDVVDFVSFVREHIHPDYVLAELLMRGIGFHYGNLPVLVRRGIEELFEEGKLRYLVCTSTLLHGVNLPARNLFLLRPSKGRGAPMSDMEFWNLAGRAGRLGKEFEGNIFLVRYSKWDKEVPGERNPEIKPSFDSILQHSPEKVVLFMQDLEHASGRDQPVENVFMRLYQCAVEGKLQSVLASLVTQADTRAEIERLMEAIRGRLDVPDVIAIRHPAISVVRQNHALQELRGLIDSRGLDYVKVPHPQSSDANKRLWRLLKFLFTTLKSNDNSNIDSYVGFLASFTLKWVRGLPIRSLVQERLDWSECEITKAVRQVIDKIERDLRFDLVKNISLYLDLLNYEVERRGWSEVKSPPFPLFLEIGACDETLIELISLGLSRSSAYIAGRLAPSMSMSRLEVCVWLVNTDWSKQGLRRIVTRELAGVLGRAKMIVADSRR